MQRAVMTMLSLAVVIALGHGACSDPDPVDPGPTTTTTTTGGTGGLGGAGGAGGEEKLPNGAECSAGAECESNNCADGICCDGACAGVCLTCSAVDSEGTCTPHDAATDPESGCQGGSCDGAGQCAVGTLAGCSGFGDGAAGQTVHQVVGDRDSNSILIGSFQGAVSFGSAGDELISAGGEDVFLAKLGPGGEHLWSRRFGDGANQIGYSAGTDVMNGIVIAGSFEGTISFGGDDLTSAGGSDIFLARFDADGNHVFSQRFGDGDSQIARSLVVTPCGDIVITGSLAGSVSFDGGATQLASAGGDDIFVARFLPDGTPKHSARFGDAAALQEGRSLGADTDGNVILLGHFQGTVDLGGGVLTGDDAGDVFIAKLDPNGGHLWSRSFGDDAAQRAGGVAVDGHYDIVLSGAFEGSVSFGAAADELTSAGGSDIFVAKLDRDGNHLWSHSFGDATDQGPDHHSLAVDSGGNAVLVGAFAGSVDFGGGSLASSGLEDVYLAKLSAGGVHLWSQRFGGTGSEGGVSVATDFLRNITAVGRYQGAPDFGGGPLPDQSSDGIFVARFAP